MTDNVISMEQYPRRTELTELLFELHSLAMDASAEPTPTRLMDVRQAFKKVERHLPEFYDEYYRSAKR